MSSLKKHDTFLGSLFLVSICLVLVADTRTKYWAKSILDDTTISVIPDHLSLRYIQNDGVAFGLDIPYLGVITVILVLLLFVYYFVSFSSHTSPSYHVGFGLIMGGALGNAWERIFQGYVVDFISVPWFSVFNLADASITIGACMLLWYGYRREQGKTLS